MPTRTVTGVMLDPRGDPYPQFRMTYAPVSGAVNTATIDVTTGLDGAFGVALETGATYAVGFVSLYYSIGSSVVYPPGSRFEITVPEGVSPISLDVLRGLEGVNPRNPDTYAIIGEAVDLYLDETGVEAGPHTHPISDVIGLATQLTGLQAGVDAVDADIGRIDGDVTDLQTDISTTAQALATHQTNTSNPHSTTAAQVGAPTVAAVTAMFDGLSDVATSGAYGDLTGRPTLGTAAAANTSAFATAAQGVKADTAVQPAALTSALASKADDTDLAALLTTAAAPEVIRDTMGTALVAGENVTITPNDGADTITIAASGGGVTVAGDGEAETASRSDHAHAGGAADSVTLRGTASAEGAVAIGIGAIADSDWSTSLGNYSEAHGFGALAIHGVSTGEKSVAIGSSATAQNTGLAIGPYTSADASVAIGAAVSASAGGSAFGSSATASGIDSLALGSNASATGTRSIAIGSVTSSTANETAIGASTLRVAPAIGASTLQLRDGASAYHTVGVNTSAQITVDGNPVSSGGGNLVISDTAPTPATGDQVLWVQTNVGGNPAAITLNLVTGA